MKIRRYLLIGVACCCAALAAFEIWAAAANALAGRPVNPTQAVIGVMNGLFAALNYLTGRDAG